MTRDDISPDGAAEKRMRAWLLVEKALSGDTAGDPDAKVEEALRVDSVAVDTVLNGASDEYWAASASMTMKSPA